MLPLEGTKVLELAEFLFGPATCAILADWGAEVLKVEHPAGGDRSRGIASSGFVPPANNSTIWNQLNRGKKSVALDLHVAEGRQILLRLAADADVFLTSLLPEARRRLGITYEELRALNPRLIYVQISGYGPRGPDSERPGFDYAAFWARGGFATSVGEPEAPPVNQRPGFGDLSSGAFAAGTVAAALLRRTKTGEGAHVDTSLLAAACWVNAIDILDAYYTGRRSFREARKDSFNPLWTSYRTGDDRWIQLVMPSTYPFFPGFCQALGRPDLMQDARFSSHDAILANRGALVEILDGIFPTKTLAEWGTLLDAHGCIWGPVQDVWELLTDPQVAANEYLVTVEGIKLAASAAQFDSRPVQVRSPAPELGQHTEEVLLDLGFDWDEVEKLKATKVII